MITLYTTECAKCKILETKLNRKHLVFKKCNDVEIMKSKGITSVPMLETDNMILNFEQANKWINGVEINE